MQNEKERKVSVCIATYNGEKYIKEQIDSILPQLGQNDEIVIVDDNSKDSTVLIVKAIGDSRIHLMINESNKGVNKSFERAICAACGNYIFMSDQDDIWTENRLSIMLDNLISNNSLLVSGNSYAIDGKGEKIDFNLGFLSADDSYAFNKNIRRIFTGKAFYYGCAMAFSAELKNYILPFPDYIESHDLWIAMAANLLHSNKHIEDIVLKRRIHGKNASVVRRNIFRKLYSRVIFLKSKRVLKKRIKNYYAQTIK